MAALAALPSRSSTRNPYRPPPLSLLLPSLLSLSASATSLLSLLRLLFHFSLLVIVHVQPLTATPPSTKWPSEGSRIDSHLTFTNFTHCNNATKYPYPLNDDGLYGRCTGVYSYHIFRDYDVYFRVCFVVIPSAEERVCLASDSGYHLSLVAVIRGDTSYLNQVEVVWTANTEKPVSSNSCLQLGEDNNLKLVEYYNNSGSHEVVWETKTTRRGVRASLGFTFEGNLVLFARRTHSRFVSLWQSHQHPTDTLMVLQVLHRNSTLTVRHSADSQSPKSGNYTMVIQNGCLVLYARIGQHGDETPYGSPYWVWSNSSSAIDRRCAPTDKGINFVALCWESGNQLHLYAGYNRSRVTAEISPEDCSSMHYNGDLKPIIRIKDTNTTTYGKVTYSTFMKLDADGDLRAYTNKYDGKSRWNSDWSSFYSVFQDRPCHLPLYCGFYGKCDQKRKKHSHCTCDTGFEFKDASNVHLGCKLKNDREGHAQLPTNGSVCASADSSVKFLRLDKVHYFSLEFTDHDLYPAPKNKYNGTIDDCPKTCQNDCNCAAAFWDPITGFCFLIRGQVGTIQHGAMVAFIKYVYVRPAKKSPQHWIVIGPAVAATILTIAFAMACVYLYYRRRFLRRRSAELEKERMLLSLLGSDCPSRFTWQQMHDYTCGFSHLLGGGGFGSVFRGSLPDATAIAVKQMGEDASYGQGDKEFLAEVSILSRIHHAHLVRLIGFCFEGAHRLLVYEFMENGSLDSWLFRGPVITNQKRRKAVLSWKTRFQIALGTSKGLAYLHEECEERVIHMDFKPQNILLGRDFVPKISDFGMSRRINREQSSVITVLKGTPGYLAPEWLLDYAVSEKCDVYSFGIVLLEMVSGRKVRDLGELKQKLRMRSLRESVMLELLDDHLKNYCDGSDVTEDEAVRMVEVALLCVRTDPKKRPTMSSVALMLEGKAEVEEAALEEDEGDVDGEEELVMYRSSMKQTIRSMGRSSGRLSTSVRDYSKGNNLKLSTSCSYRLGSSSHSSSFSKKMKSMSSSSSYMEIDGSPECDALLN